MIRIRHNGVERETSAEGLLNLAELVAWSCREAGLGEEVVVDCRVNGMALDEERLAALDAVPIEQLAAVEVETRAPAAIALSSLSSSRDYTDRVRAAFQRTAGLLREGKLEDANQLYVDAIDALSVLVYAIRTAGEQLGEPAAPLTRVEAEVHPWLNQLLDAQETRDWVRVADYLEYEVEPILADWGRRIDGVRRELGEAPRA